MPAVSVVIGTYNCAQFVPGALECVFRQTFTDYEVVVVDDASTDNTVAVLEQYRPRIRLVRRSVNSSSCELPRYEGVVESRAPCCAFLDADDRWDPTFLDKTMEFLAGHPQAAMVHTYARVIDAADRVLRVRHEGAMPQGADLVPALLRHCYITISAVVVRRAVWLETLPAEALIEYGMDQDFFLWIAKRHAVGFIPQVLMSYRRSSASISEQRWRRQPRNVYILERFLRLGYWRGLATRAGMRAIVSEAYAENAEHWLAAGRPGRALWCCGRGLAHRPAHGPLARCAVRALLAAARRTAHGSPEVA